MFIARLVAVLVVVVGMGFESAIAARGESSGEWSSRGRGSRGKSERAPFSREAFDAQKRNVEIVAKIAQSVGVEASPTLASMVSQALSNIREVGMFQTPSDAESIVARLQNGELQLAAAAAEAAEVNRQSTAATKIQSTYRGSRARSTVAGMRAEKAADVARALENDNSLLDHAETLVRSSSLTVDGKQALNTAIEQSVNEGVLRAPLSEQQRNFLQLITDIAQAMPAPKDLERGARRRAAPGESEEFRKSEVKSDFLSEIVSDALSTAAANVNETAGGRASAGELLVAYTNEFSAVRTKINDGTFKREAKTGERWGKVRTSARETGKGIVSARRAAEEARIAAEKEAAETKRLAGAATKIQSVYRGHKVRQTGEVAQQAKMKEQLTAAIASARTSIVESGIREIAGQYVNAIAAPLRVRDDSTRGGFGAEIAMTTEIFETKMSLIQLVVQIAQAIPTENETLASIVSQDLAEMLTSYKSNPVVELRSVASRLQAVFSNLDEYAKKAKTMDASAKAKGRWGKVRTNAHEVGENALVDRQTNEVMAGVRSYVGTENARQAAEEAARQAAAEAAAAATKIQAVARGRKARVKVAGMKADIAAKEEAARLAAEQEAARKAAEEAEIARLAAEVNAKIAADKKAAAAGRMAKVKALGKAYGKSAGVLAREIKNADTVSATTQLSDDAKVSFNAIRAAAQADAADLLETARDNMSNLTPEKYELVTAKRRLLGLATAIAKKMPADASVGLQANIAEALNEAQTAYQAATPTASDLARASNKLSEKLSALRTGALAQALKALDDVEAAKNFAAGRDRATVQITRLLGQIGKEIARASLVKAPAEKIAAIEDAQGYLAAAAMVFKEFGASLTTVMPTLTDDIKETTATLNTLMDETKAAIAAAQAAAAAPAATGWRAGFAKCTMGIGMATRGLMESASAIGANIAKSDAGKAVMAATAATVTAAKAAYDAAKAKADATGGATPTPAGS